MTTKHIGRNKSNGMNVVVVYNYIYPKNGLGDTEIDYTNCWVFESGSFPNGFAETAIMNIVNSKVAQSSATVHLGQLFQRETVSSGETALVYLRRLALLKKMPISSIELVLDNKTAIPLSMLVEDLKVKESKQDKYDLNKMLAADMEKSAQYADASAADNNDDVKGTAISIIRQAQLLQTDVNQLKAKAEKMYPGILKEFKLDGSDATTISPLSELNKIQPNDETLVKPSESK